MTTNQIKDTVIAHRRTIHRLAELGGQEYKTRDYILEYIKKWGLPYEMVTETAILATLDTGRAGPHIALRADMDALPVKENPENLKGPRTCVSQQEGTCHACGHDAHTAMLLGSMEVLLEQKDTLNGTLYFCFEAGEEVGTSSRQIVEALGHRKVDTVWAIHVYSPLPSGQIGIRDGACMAGFGGMDITVQGKGGHGSRPDLSRNPVFAAADIVSTLPGVFVNQLNVEKTVTFGITSIQGGETFNVFPETARIQGSMRFFDLEEGQKAMDLVKNTAQHMAAIHGCQVSFGRVMDHVGIPVINSAPHAQRARQVARDLYGDAAVPQEFPLWYASESFSTYCRAYPGVLALLGIQNLEKGCGAEHHNERFDIDEDALDMGVQVTVGYVRSLMDHGLPV